MVSVIIPNFNNSKWLPHCLQSCLDQSKYLKEIIIIDDQSTDNSWSLLEEFQKGYSDIIRIFRNPNKGGNHARNYGFQQSTGKYIQWLDSDDRLLPEKLEAQMSYLESHPETDIVYSDWQKDFYKEDKLVRSEKIKYGPYDDFLYELIKDNWTVPCNYLLRRSVAEKLDNGFGWNPVTKVGQDREYFSKAAILGAKFSYVPGDFASYTQWSENTVSKMKFNQRLHESYKLEKELKELIKSQKWISASMKNKYIRVLNSQALLGKYYNSSLPIKKDFGIHHVNWMYIHWKVRFLIFFKFIFTKVEYALKNKN